MLKYLNIGRNCKGGRNSRGKITVYQRGKVIKEKYKYIDYGKKIIDVPFKLIKKIYNYYGRKVIGLVGYSNGILSYITSIQNMKIGEWYMNNMGVTGVVSNGNAMKLSRIGLGGIVSQIAKDEKSKIKYLRSGGVFGQIVSVIGEEVIIKMMSGELRKFYKGSYGVIGNVEESKAMKTEKAGDTRRRGIKPTVRGIAMNPIDHPHGGRTSRKGETPWGKKTKGPKTRIKGKVDWIVKRRNE